MARSGDYPWHITHGKAVIRLFDAGASYYQIAVRFGVTRNQIAGYFRRIGKRREHNALPAPPKRLQLPAPKSLMSRDEFLDDVVRRMGTQRYRTQTGLQSGSFYSTALRCNCGVPECLGWALFRPEEVAEQIRIFGADADR